MKYFYINILVLVFISINCFSQTILEIKKSDNFYWGEGKGQSLEQADKTALKDLISQISVQIEHTMKSIWTEGNGTFKEFTESVTNTYSSATLDRAERKVDETENGTTVLRYITKTKLDEIFIDRKNKIFDYIKTAQYAESELRIGDALKYYYWSLALLRSHPDCNKIKFKISGNEELILLTALPDKISSILNQLNVDITSINEKDNIKDVMIKIKFQDKLVQNFDFSYWAGDTWTVLNSTKNGIGNVELSGEAAHSLKDLRIKTEYIFKNNSKIDSEVQNVIENTSIPTFKNAEIKTILKVNNVAVKEKTNATEKSIAAESKDTVKKSEIFVPVTEYERIILKITNAIKTNTKSIVKPLFTEEGYKLFEKLMSYGKVKILPQSNLLKAVKFNEQVVIRSVPMKFTFNKNNKSFIEEVVFIFNGEKKINSLSFTLGEKAVSDILSKSEVFATLENKYQIIQFMEDYKTAYCLGRIDYLDQIFADNALIIVGSILKNDNNPIDKMYVGLGEEKVNYIKYSKKEYIEKLKNTFRNNEFVNIAFDENTVKKVKVNEKIYGIQIAQNWYSSNYADKGYLFLMIDLNDSVNPKIYVRTWQPKRNSDGSVIGVTDFNF